jgi:hypothetical protein
MRAAGESVAIAGRRAATTGGGVDMWMKGEPRKGAALTRWRLFCLAHPTLRHDTALLYFTKSEQKKKPSKTGKTRARKD